jgi:4-hydroxybenzoate polyprenyltransferase
VFRTIRHLLEMIRFSHTLFALPFALLAAVMAWRMNAIRPAAYEIVAKGTRYTLAPIQQLTHIGPFAIQWQEVAGILLCMVTARSAAMAFNRIADRNLDAGNPRTAQRHLPAGILSVRKVVAFAMANSIAFILVTITFLPNWLPMALSVPVLGFLLAYSYTKRFTALAHFWLGASLMLAPISTWIAIRGLRLLHNDALDIVPAVVLGLAVLLWVSGFDIIYACQDADFDRHAKLHSIPASLGVASALRLAAALHAGMIVALAALPRAAPQLQLGGIYWAGVAAVAALLIYEHALVRPNDLSRVNVAFFYVNAIVSVGLLAVVTLDLIT